jgi:polar amino acid transport system substrate-binding protein
VRKVAALLLVFALAGVAAGCGGGDDDEQAGGTTGTTSTNASTCARDDLDLKTSDQLTIATGNPTYPPWFEGGKAQGTVWRGSNPANDQGFESAFAYALAEQLGFTKDAVEWIPIAFNPSIAPGPKDYDLNIQQISYSPERAKAVALSDSYFEVNQSVVGIKGTPVTQATSLTDLKQFKLGAQVGTTSYQYIVDEIQPDKDPQVYDDLNAAIAALNNGQIDGIVTDFAGAYYMANVQLDNGTIVGRLPTIGTQEHFSVALEKDSPLLGCVNEAIAALKQDGTLDQLEQEWIAGKAKAPLIAS